MEIICTGLNHRKAPVDVRERFAFSDHILPETLDRLLGNGNGSVQEAVILSTCNRVEIYAACSEAGKGFAALRDLLKTQGHVEDLKSDWLYQKSFPDSVGHLFRVASGLDSMMLGETEIFGQVKKAYATALQHGASSRYLNKLFQKAFRAGKHVRSATQITRGSVSVGSAAVELAGKIFGDLKQHRAMILGAGEISERTARSLMSRGVHSLIVSNRSIDRAKRIAEELEGDAVTFEDWPAHLLETDIVICSTAAPHHVVTREKVSAALKKRRKPLFIIDLAVPRDVAPEVHDLDNVYVYDIDGLEHIANQAGLERQKEVAAAQKLITGHLQEFEEWFGKQKSCTKEKSPQSGAEKDGNTGEICLQNSL